MWNKKNQKVMKKSNGNNQNNKDDDARRQRQQNPKTGTTPASPNNNDLTTDSVYEFYTEQLFPAIWASIPLLVNRICHDVSATLGSMSEQTLQFLKPNFKHVFEDSVLTDNVGSLFKNTTDIMDTMIRHLDTNKDGHISAKELLHFQDFHLPNLVLLQPPSEKATAQLLTTKAWIKSWLSLSLGQMMDWKVLGLYLMRSCGGLLLAIAIATIIPGRLHGLSGRLLRWPILFITYWMITIELVVYVFVRMFIRCAEVVFANSKHRNLRKACEQSKSYDEWYKYSQQLDDSQGRSKWQRTIDDDTSYQYNWNFIQELMVDMRTARQNQDALQALAVLQQCTRKNVGGIMSEDMFSYLNTGEPKDIVEEFVEEVVQTLQWVTEEAIATPPPPQIMVDVVNNNDGIAMSDAGSDHDQDTRILLGTTTATSTATISPRTNNTSNQEEEKYEFDLQQKIVEETTKLLMSWTSFLFLDKNKPQESSSNNHEPKPEQSVTRETPLETSSSFEDEQQKEQHHHHQQNATATTNVPTVQHQHQLPIVHHRERVKTFLKRARAAYGRTAMCLSGGAMMGNYHWGHLKALLEANALPHIISGTSAGSVVGALVCCRTDDEIQRDMRPEILVDKLTCFSKSWPDRIRNVYHKHHMFDNEDWLDTIKWFTCGDMTFEEAYRKTGRVLCITLSATTKKAPPILANYISAPNVTIASAIIASAAVPGFIKPVVLQYKDSDGVVRDQNANKGETYWDGSIDQDIPTSGLAEMLNCQFFVAAQCNPHIVPFFYNSKGDVGRPSRWSSGMRDDSWRGGFLLSAMELYLKNDMRAKFHFLNDLDAAVSFTSTMMTQQTYGGSTTIVPQVVFQDYFQLFTNPSLKFLQRCFQAGSVAAYQHIAMIKLHYRTAYALEECLAMLERCDVDNVDHLKPRRRRSQLAISAALAASNMDTNNNATSSSNNSHSSDNSRIMAWRKQQQQQPKQQQRNGGAVSSTSIRGKQSGGLLVSALTPKADLVVGKQGGGGGLHNGNGTTATAEARTFSVSSAGSMDGADDEYEQGGFDGMDLSFSGHGRLGTASSFG